jgi:hypothetical protein
MAARKSKVVVVKSAPLIKSVDASVAKLSEVMKSAKAGIAGRTKDSGKQLAEIRKLKKKRTTLANKKNRLVAGNKKKPVTGYAKQLAALKKEIAGIDKLKTKATTVRQANLSELAALRALLKRTSDYNKGIANTDKILNKPKKRAKKKAVRRVTPAVVAVEKTEEAVTEKAVAEE